MFALLFAMTLAADAPAAAPPTGAPPASAAPARKAQSDYETKMVCIYVDRPQSRFRDRVCATQADWDERERQDQQIRERMMQNSTPAPTPGR